MTTFNLNDKLRRSGLVRFPEGQLSREQLALVERDWEYRYTLLDRFSTLPRLAADYNIDGTNVGTITIDQEILGNSNHNWMLAGTNAAIADAIFESRGGLKLELLTTGADQDQLILTPVNSSDAQYDSGLLAVTWDFANQPSILAVLRRDTLASEFTNYEILVGFSDAVDVNITAATDAVGVKFVVTAGDGTTPGTIVATLEEEIAGTASTSQAITFGNTTGKLTWGVDTVLMAEIRIDAYRRAHVLFDGIEVLVSANQLDATITAVKPIVGFEQTEAEVSNKPPALGIHALEVGQNYD